MLTDGLIISFIFVLLILHCGPVGHIAIWICVNMGSGDGLVPDGTKPLPKPMLTSHQWSSVANTWKQFHGKCPSYIFCNKFENYTFKITATSPRVQWVNITISSSQYRDSYCEDSLSIILLLR